MMLKRAMSEVAQRLVLLNVIPVILQMYKDCSRAKRETIQIFTSGLWSLLLTVTDHRSLEIVTNRSNSKTSYFISEVDVYSMQC